LWGEGKGDLFGEKRGGGKGGKLQKKKFLPIKGGKILASITYLEKINEKRRKGEITCH